MWLAAHNLQLRMVGKDDQCAQQHVRLQQGGPAGWPLINCCLAVLNVAQGCQSHAIGPAQIKIGGALGHIMAGRTVLAGEAAATARRG